MPFSIEIYGHTQAPKGEKRWCFQLLNAFLKGSHFPPIEIGADRSFAWTVDNTKVELGNVKDIANGKNKEWEIVYTNKQ